MSSSSFSRIISTGLAMFSMFFGAGNVVFPLVVGQVSGDQTIFAIIGLLVTAVGVPFLGLMAILMHKGSYQQFFARLGIVPGFFLIALIMLMIGPLGALPRCIALSFSTLKLTWTQISFPLFSFASCLIIFLCTYKKNNMINLLGNILTPLLLISLAVIVVVGLCTGESAYSTSLTSFQSFFHGFKEGYNTMDFLVSFFFSAIVYNTLKEEAETKNMKGTDLISLSLKASCVGAFLLSLVYIGFSLVASWHSASLNGIDHSELLGILAFKILGPYAGLVASSAVALACLTTAIALAAVFAEFLKKDLLNNRINYGQSLIITLIISFAISLLEFSGISALLNPLLQIAYPILIAYTIFSLVKGVKRNSQLVAEAV